MNAFVPEVVVLLNGVAATGESQWISFGDYRGKSIDLYVSTATVQVRLSNNQNKPAASDNGNKFGSDLNSSGITQITTDAMWIKLMVTSLGSGTVTAYLFGQRVIVRYPVP
jgi:hypothetical protein